MGAVIKSGSVCWCLCPKGRISGQSVVIVTVTVVLNQNRNKSWQHCAIYNVDPSCGSDSAAGTVLNYSTQTLLNQAGGNSTKPLTLIYKL